MGDDSILGEHVKAYWLEVADRAARTFCQTLAPLLLVGPLAGWMDIDWLQAVNVASLAAFASVLTSIGTKGFGADHSTPSLFVAHTIRPPASRRYRAVDGTGRHRGEP